VVEDETLCRRVTEEALCRVEDRSLCGDEEETLWLVEENVLCGVDVKHLLDEARLYRLVVSNSNSKSVSRSSV